MKHLGSRVLSTTGVVCATADLACISAAKSRGAFVSRAAAVDGVVGGWLCK